MIFGEASPRPYWSIYPTKSKLHDWLRITFSAARVNWPAGLVPRISLYVALDDPANSLWSTLQLFDSITLLPLPSTSAIRDRPFGRPSYRRNASDRSILALRPLTPYHFSVCTYCFANQPHQPSSLIPQPFHQRNPDSRVHIHYQHCKTTPSIQLRKLYNLSLLVN